MRLVKDFVRRILHTLVRTTERTCDKGSCALFSQRWHRHNALQQDALQELVEHAGDLAPVHIDSDLCSSAKTILDELAPRIRAAD